MSNAPPIFAPHAEGVSIWTTERGTVLHVEVGGEVVRVEAAGTQIAEDLLRLRLRQMAAARGLVIPAATGLANTITRLRGVL
jgi:hypothetical protein